jgi:hypothetical protein
MPGKELLTALSIALLTFALNGCEREGPAERAGEKIDSAVEKMGEKVEKAGEKVQETAKDAQK